ncbi:MAG: beta-ketoacyl synthase, partial [Gammaproteobacteria bacterium]|nr:beta-ketoacyl synthase [Gammaproteobacteria bacterium]
ILNEMAKVFGIDRWTVAAVKAYIGHTLAPASGDQTSSALGTWRYGWIPGIATIDGPASDVHHSNLRIAPEHVEVDPATLDVAFINSKGFGGNNATGVILSPHVTRELLRARHGEQAMRRHGQRNDAVHGRALDYDAAATRGDAETIYQYGQGVLDGDDLQISTGEISVPGYDQPISLATSNPYSD